MKKFRPKKSSKGQKSKERGHKKNMRKRQTSPKFTPSKELEEGEWEDDDLKVKPSKEVERSR